eukprot:COSAG04_NODE_209_length_20232_cov_116.817315_23_plen_178_part_00
MLQRSAVGTVAEKRLLAVAVADRDWLTVTAAVADGRPLLRPAWGVVFCLLGNSTGTLGNREASAGGYFGGFSWRTWLVVVINAFLGQVVSRVMKCAPAEPSSPLSAPMHSSRVSCLTLAVGLWLRRYADNITKVFAASSGVVRPPSPPSSSRSLPVVVLLWQPLLLLLSSRCRRVVR